GLLAPLLAKRGHSLRYVDVPVADLESVDPLAPDLFVVLGGPIGVYENDSYPFVDAEVALIEKRLASAKPLLGICLGSQLIAKAVGAALEAWLVGHTAEISRIPGISVKSLRADTARCTPAIERAGAACFADWLTAQRL